nr:hypothetical protein [Bacillota bacterium]
MRDVVGEDELTGDHPCTAEGLGDVELGPISDWNGPCRQVMREKIPPVSRKRSGMFVAATCHCSGHPATFPALR